LSLANLHRWPANAGPIAVYTLQRRGAPVATQKRGGLYSPTTLTDRVTERSLSDFLRFRPPDAYTAQGHLAVYQAIKKI